MASYLRRTIVLIVAIFLFSAAAHKEEDKICVTLKTGKVMYQHSEKDPWLMINKSAPKVCLGDQARIKIAPNADVQITRGAKNLTYPTPGIWKVSALISKANAKPSIFNKTIDFLIEKAKKSPFSLDEYAKVNMRQKGVVSRDGECTPLMESPFFGTNLTETKVRFSWTAVENNGPYTFSIYEEASQTAQPIYSMDTTATGVDINLTDLEVETGQDYYWSVAPKGTKNCVTYAFRVVAPDITQELKASLAALNAELPANPALNAATTAAFCEEQNFLVDANNKYEAALNMEPENTLFRQAYGLFLARNGQLKAAKKVLR